MNALKVSLIFSFFIVLTTGCASQKKIFLTEGVIKNTSSSSFSVVPYNQYWVPDATTKRMRGQETDFFFQALPPAFSSNTPNKVTVVKSGLKLSQSNFKEQTLTNDNFQLTFNIPTDTLLSTIDDRYIYFLDGYQFKFDQEIGDRVGYAYERSESKIALQFETKFFLFDKRKSEIIAWGMVSDKFEIQGRPKFTDYLEVITKVSRQMIKESPFTIYELKEL